jgi:hypothetical protein
VLFGKSQGYQGNSNSFIDSYRKLLYKRRRTTKNVRKQLETTRYNKKRERAVTWRKNNPPSKCKYLSYNF